MRTTILAILTFINFTSFGQTHNQYENFTASSKALILSYDDLGPQVLAHDLIGFQWWQWDNHGNSNPKTKYDIRVIIFKGISLETVKNQYPINQNRKVDFRYISYNESIKYLDRIINEYKNELDIDRYSLLRRKIISYFKPKE